jgi:hypothetical protein
MHLLGCDRTLICLAELVDGFVVTSEILLATDQDDGQAGAEVHDFRDPLNENDKSVSHANKSTRLMQYLLLNIVQRIWAVNGEAN